MDGVEWLSALVSNPGKSTTLRLDIKLSLLLSVCKAELFNWMLENSDSTALWTGGSLKISYTTL